MGIEILKIEVDADGNGMSILRRRYETINAVNFYSQNERQSFRKTTINGNNETVVNNNFSQELNDFTGVNNFLAEFYNF